MAVATKQSGYGPVPFGACLWPFFILLAGCFQSISDPNWYGYYYENLQTNERAAISRPFATARECRRAMLDYMRGSPVMSGFACAQGCPPSGNELVSDCRKVVH